MKSINNESTPKKEEESSGITFYLLNGLLIFSALLFIGYLIYLYVS